MWLHLLEINSSSVHMYILVCFIWNYPIFNSVNWLFDICFAENYMKMKKMDCEGGVRPLLPLDPSLLLTLIAITCCVSGLTAVGPLGEDFPLSRIDELNQGNATIKPDVSTLHSAPSSSNGCVLNTLNTLQEEHSLLWLVPLADPRR